MHCARANDKLLSLSKIMVVMMMMMMMLMAIVLDDDLISEYVKGKILTMRQLDLFVFILTCFINLICASFSYASPIK